MTLGGVLLGGVQGLLMLAGTLVALVGAVAGWVFVIRYRKKPWRKYEIGRNLMRTSFALSVILTYVVLFQLTSLIVHETPVLDWVVVISRLVIFAWVADLLVSRARLILGDTTRLLVPDQPDEDADALR